MKAQFSLFKKYFFISSFIILIFGFHAPVNREIASLDNNCKGQATLSSSLMGIVKGLIDDQSVINNKIEEETEVFNPHIYSKKGFFFHGQLNYTTYKPIAFDQEFTKQQLTAYEAKVNELAQYREKQMQSAWAPEFGSEGELLNPFYGFGEKTSQGIKQMYEFPLMANPIIGYTPAEQKSLQVTNQASKTVYYPQTSAI